MAEYFDVDELTKGYDPVIVSRIMAYTKPYSGLVIVSVIALILATAGELFVPVLLRATVDDALMPSWVGVSQVPPELERELELDDSSPSVKTMRFARTSAYSRISKALRSDLETSGSVDPGPWYVLKTNDPVVKAQAGLSGARMGDLWAALTMKELHALPGETVRILRSGDTSLLGRNIVFFIVAIVIVLGATFAQTWYSSLVGQRVMKDIRLDLFKHVASRSLAFLSRQPVGRLVTRMTSDVETINEFFTNVVVSFAKDASLMLGVLVALFILSPSLALLTLLTMPPVIIVTFISRTRARDAFRRQRQSLSKVNSYLSERISGVSIVKLFAREKASLQEFEERDGELMKANLAEMMVFATFRPLVDFLGSISLAAILWFGAGFHQGGIISLGTLMAFVNLIRMFYSPVQDIAEKYTILQSAMAGGERVFKLLESGEAIPNNPVRSMPDPVRGRLEFDHVWFAYIDEEWVLKDVSFTVESGEMIAVVGYTGAGKTTIANLLARLWDVQRGVIRLDGIPITDLDLHELRKAIRPVPQEVFLFSGTIGENIRLGEALDGEATARAAQAVEADRFIRALPDAYEAELSEAGSNLSGGQRQLLSFARVVAHNPAVIVLDEATSSVDTETEKLVQRGLEEMLENRTSLVIAHRLSTIRHANRIIVLAEGRLIETGTHDELIRKGGDYYNLYQLQYAKEAGQGGVVCN